jgi:predicted acyl esterase
MLRCRRNSGLAGAKTRGGTTKMIRIRAIALASAAALTLSAGATPVMAQAAKAKPAAAAQKPAPWPGLPPGATEEYMTLRDGVRLAANVFKPAGTGPWPVVLSRTPYLKDGAIDREKDPKGEAVRKRFADQAKRYTDAGFVFVVQDVRGKGRSQGFYTAFENDIEDG